MNDQKKPDTYPASLLNVGLGICGACGNFLDAFHRYTDGYYIPKTIEEHQEDRTLTSSFPQRHRKPVAICPLCHMEPPNVEIRGTL